MADAPADMTKGEDAPGEGIEQAGFRPGPRNALLTPRLVIIIAAVSFGIIATLLDLVGVRLFDMGGALMATGLIAIALAAFFGFVSAGANDLTRSPLAAAEAFNALPDPCYVTDRRGAVLFANEAYRHLAGVYAQDERPASLERLLAGRADSAEIAFRLAQAARTGFAADEEVRLAIRSGFTRIYKVIVRPMSGARGGAVWLFRDLTVERERLEVAERRLSAFTSYLDGAPAGLFIVGPGGEIDYANAALAGWLGLDAGHIAEQGTTLDAIAASAFSDILDAEGDEPGFVGPVDAELKKTDGTLLPVRVVARRIRRDGGQGWCVLALDRELSGEGQDNARDAQLRFARFFNNAPIGIATVDTQGRIENANSAFMAYVGGEAVRGQALAELLVEDDRPAVLETLSDTSAGQTAGPAVDIHLLNHPDRVAQLYAARIDTGEGASLVVYLIDATEQKSLEMQFAQSQKMQAVGQLAGGVAHDFNNLLTAIIGFCDLLLARHQAGDPSFADVVQIKQNANRAANLTRQLLAFSRRQTLRPKVLSLTDSLAELQNLLARLLTEQVELKIVHGRDLGLVKVDQNQLEQVIMNLAVNARDAMPEGGRLTIRTANVSEEDSRALDHALMPVGEYVLIEVSDTGFGIPKENLGKIFEPFYTTKDPSKGTGLGLSTVYGIVKQTGGYIFPYSTVGKGTSFRIYLPRYVETAAEKAANEEEIAVPPPEAADLTGKGTILLVEDEDAVRTFAARALETRGYEVLQAESGEAALDVVAGFDGRIDLVVSDVVMPNMDGPTMVKELKGRIPDTKIVFVSGYAEDAFAKSLDPDQEFHFLPKPFSLKQLASMVKDVMNG